MRKLKNEYQENVYLENYPKTTIKEVLIKAKKRLYSEILKIELDWIEILKTKANYWWERIWFKCPNCSNRVFTLYDIKGSFKCRKCSWLKYKKQRIKWMLEDKI